MKFVQRIPCHYYNYDYKELSELSYQEALNVTRNSSKPELKKCTTLVWKITDRGYTYIDEFSLQCNRHIWDPTSIGQITGHLITGFVADIYGRKLSIMAALFVLVIACIVLAVSPTSLFIHISSFLIGGSAGSIANLTQILFLEIVNYKLRIYVAATMRLGYSVGYFMQAGLYYYIQHWRHYQWAVNCTLIIPLLSQWLLPESPHWLLCNKRWQKLEEVLRDLNYPAVLTVDTEVYQNSKPSQLMTVQKISKVLYKPIFRKRLILGAFLYGLVYFLYTREKRRILNFINLQLTFYAILGVSVIVNMAVVPLMLKRFERPMCICIGLLLLGVFYCSFTIYDPYPEVGNVISCLCLVILQTVTVVNRLLIIEMFPTRVRASALSFCRSVGVLVVIITTVIEKTTDLQNTLDTYNWTAYAFIMLLAAFICVFVTNTGDVPLPDTELQAIIHF